MASDLNDCDFFSFEHQFIPETQQPPPLFVQIELTLAVRCACILHDCRTGHFIGVRIDPSISQETLRFDLDTLKNYNQVHQIIAPALTRLGVDPSSPFSVNLVHETINLGLTLGDCMTDRKDEALSLSLSVVMWRTIQVHVGNDGDSLSRALSESAAEFQANNYGMVPAKESSLKEMLTKVSVEVGEQDCMICLEKLEVGSDASRMPCCHIFHGDCIEKWLKQSHHCPICRYKMPT